MIFLIWGKILLIQVVVPLKTEKPKFLHSLLNSWFFITNIYCKIIQKKLQNRFVLLPIIIKNYERKFLDFFINNSKTTCNIFLVILIAKVSLFEYRKYFLVFLVLYFILSFGIRLPHRQGHLNINHLVLLSFVLLVNYTFAP